MSIVDFLRTSSPRQKLWYVLSLLTWLLCVVAISGTLGFLLSLGDISWFTMSVRASLVLYIGYRFAPEFDQLSKRISRFWSKTLRTSKRTTSRLEEEEE